MQKGMALLISVNEVNPDAYDGEWNGRLRFPESDAEAIAEIAVGFEKHFLRTAEATIEGVKDKIKEAADALEPGDIFLMFYSGHGNTIKDRSGDEFGDNRDETMCLYDGELLDDELYALWPRFADGVRVLVMSDSCHSGSITRGGDDDDVPKAMPQDVAKSVVRFDPEHYVRVRRTLPAEPGTIGATVRLISGCQEYERSWENKPLKHGRFTAAVLEAWDNGRFEGNYEAFHAAICKAKALGTKQTPNFDTLGASNPKFDSEKPFSIE
ncbi:MAG: caspase family protein [Gammaproteobacteria bacterium]|jgi:hypothetical protein